MKAPSWAIVIGVMMILFGGCSTIQSFSETNTKENYKKQLKILEEVDTGQDVEIPIFGGSLSDAARMSDYTQTWMVRFGYVGLAVALIYILGGIFLIFPQSFSIPLASGALILSMIFSVVSWIVLYLDPEPNQLMTISNSIGTAISLVIDLVLLIILLISDRSAFQNMSVEHLPTEREE